jgi:asparagine synthase (glutamine-hydrolysing)
LGRILALRKTAAKGSFFFNPQPIRQKWKEHIAGKQNWQDELWDILMFQAWQESA